MDKIKKRLKNLNILEKIICLMLLIISFKILFDKFIFHNRFNVVLEINFNFLLCSIFLNLVLIYIIYKTFSINKIKFTKKEIGILVLLITITLVLYIYNIISRQFLYYQDYTVYYQLQTNLEKVFSSNNLVNSLFYVLKSIWYNDYASFLSLFTEITYQFANKFIDSFVVSESFIIIPLLFFCIFGFIKTLFKKNNPKLLYLLLFISFITPLFHCNLILGMPDVIGLVFVFLIIILTINYDFKEIELFRLILIGIVAFFLIISRRWYIYWTFSYFLLYALKLLIVPFFKKDYKSLKKILFNGLKFAIVFALLVGIILFPMFKRILLANYSKNYSFYKYGGIFYELLSQIKRFGLISIILSSLGYVSLIKKDNKEYRK